MVSEGSIRFTNQAHVHLVNIRSEPDRNLNFSTRDSPVSASYPIDSMNLALHPMQTFIITLALAALGFIGGEANAQPIVNQSPPPADLGKRLADQMPKPLPAPTTQSPSGTVREQVFKRFATWPGVIVAAVTLILTLIICRPRGQKQRAANAPFTISSQDRPAPPAKPMNLVEAFNESMGMNYERWHDGIGYDLSLIDKATPAERAEIETLLLKEPVNDWRVVEGLARLRTPTTISKLQQTLASSTDYEVKMAITEYAADLITVEQRSAAIIAALREAPLIKGLHLALRQLASFHPPEIINELLQATLHREGDAAMHCAAHLLVIHGKAASPFAEPHRAFLNRFATKDSVERRAAHEELLRLISG